MRKIYEQPKLVEYGPITDCTFMLPGGNIKGCVTDCHLDKYGEQSGIDPLDGSRRSSRCQPSNPGIGLAVPGFGLAAHPVHEHSCGAANSPFFFQGADSPW